MQAAPARRVVHPDPEPVADDAGLGESGGDGAQALGEGRGLEDLVHRLLQRADECGAAFGVVAQELRGRDGRLKLLGLALGVAHHVGARLAQGHPRVLVHVAEGRIAHAQQQEQRDKDGGEPRPGRGQQPRRQLDQPAQQDRGRREPELHEHAQVADAGFEALHVGRGGGHARSGPHGGQHGPGKHGAAQRPIDRPEEAQAHRAAGRAQPEPDSAQCRG